MHYIAHLSIPINIFANYPYSSVDFFCVTLSLSASVSNLKTHNKMHSNVKSKTVLKSRIKKSFLCRIFQGKWNERRKIET